jgi:hypothetical protein
MHYDVSGSSITGIGDGGLAANASAGVAASLQAGASAGGGSTLYQWMQNLALSGSSGPGQLSDIVHTTSSGGLAETGIVHASVSTSGAGSLDSRMAISADATGGGQAHTYFGDVHLVSTTTDSASRSHLGDGHPYGTGSGPGNGVLGTDLGDPAHGNLDPGVLAHADGAGSVATIATAGDFDVTASGGAASAELRGLVAQGTNGGEAHIDIGGDLIVSARSSGANPANAYLFMEAEGSADIHVHGNVSVIARSSGLFGNEPVTGIRATDGGQLIIDGDFNSISSGTFQNRFQLVSQNGSTLQIGDVNFDNTGSTHGWIDIYNDRAGGMHLGDINVNVGTNADVRIHFQDAASSPATVSDTLMYHNNPRAADHVEMDNINITGGGTAYLYLTGGFDMHEINLGPNLSDVHFKLYTDPGSYALADAPSTIVHGFIGNRDAVTQGDNTALNASADNFLNVGSFTSAAAMGSAFDDALSGTVKWVFAEYNGTEDINHNGVADDAGQGVLAWNWADNHPLGISGALYMPGVTTMTHQDLL